MSVRKTNEPEGVEVCGKPFHCTACGNDRFHRRKALLKHVVGHIFGLRLGQPPGGLCRLLPLRLYPLVPLTVIHRNARSQQSAQLWAAAHAHRDRSSAIFASS
jgi:hypothetical protein